MKIFIAPLTALVASVSFASGVSAATNGSTCGVVTQDDSFFSVVGVQGTGVHPRLELRELEKDRVSWNLFLQAMARFQAMDQSEKLSYFKIASIHGAPFGPWDQVEGEGMTGYCPHVSNMFGTWHRPYLALFEQVMHDRAVEIANEYPFGNTRNAYQEAASKLRLPYWDWAINPPDAEEGCMPYSMRSPTVGVTLANGTNATISNPLAQYRFHPLNATDFDVLEGFQFSNWNTTIRYPQDGFSVTATSRNDELNVRIGAQQVSNRDMLYKLLTVYQPFNEWSNKANGGKIGNVETLHDGIHNSFGLGHVGIVEVAAFDPAFWLHHCNIDRIVAMFQHRYPDTFVEDSPQAKASYYYAKDSTQGTESPLKPFHMNPKGDFWTSTTSRNWESFGYTYPELVGKPDNDTLTRSINQLYKPETQGLSTNNSTSTRRTYSEGNETADATDWMAEVNMPCDIQITYAVRVFLGEPDEDPEVWPTDKNYVGQVASLASPRSNSDVILTHNVILTDKLAEKYKNGELQSLDKDHVEAWLKENFHWRIQQVDLTEIPRDNPPPGLNVTVVSVPIHLPVSDTEVPVWPGGTEAFEYKPEAQAPPPVYPPNSTYGDDGKGNWNGTSWNVKIVTIIETKTITVEVPEATPYGSYNR